MKLKTLLCGILWFAYAICHAANPARIDAAKEAIAIAAPGADLRSHQFVIGGAAGITRQTLIFGRDEFATLAAVVRRAQPAPNPAAAVFRSNNIILGCGIIPLNDNEIAFGGCDGEPIYRASLSPREYNTIRRMLLRLE